jgi:hypothetical protein
LAAPAEGMRMKPGIFSPFFRGASWWRIVRIYNAAAARPALGYIQHRQLAAVLTSMSICLLHLHLAPDPHPPSPPCTCTCSRPSSAVHAVALAQRITHWLLAVS